MKLITLAVSYLQENTYIYFDETSSIGVIIDPGAEPDKIYTAVKNNALKITHILLTHGHWDHIGAVEKLVEKTGAKVAVHEAELELLKMFAAEIRSDIKVDTVLKNGDIIPVAGTKLKVLHTPGHTPGGVCFYDEAEKILFTGDTLFYESVGRTDFEYSEPEDELASIVNVIYKLPEDVIAFPGHGPKTTIGHEIARNPFVGRNGLR